MKPEYEPQTWDQVLGYLVEECGEVLAAAGKTIRWGTTSVNPDLPYEQQETNARWLLRELRDLSGAIKRVRRWLPEDGNDVPCDPYAATGEGE